MGRVLSVILESLSKPKISRVKLNILANFIGQGWAGLTNFVAVPLYIQFLGIEAFGLIGFYAVLQAALSVFDFGLSTSINRELARASARSEQMPEARNLVRTLEVLYWALGILLGGTVWIIAPFLAEHWINAETLPPAVLLQAVRVMGVVTALQWPLSFYQGGLQGLQRQSLLNTLNIVSTTMQHGGAVFILYKFGPSVTNYFLWQIPASLLRVGLVYIFLWRSLSHADHTPRFDLSLVRQTWRFAAGMTGIALSALVLTQLDKAILSKMLPLTQFGYYTLAMTVSSSVPTMIVGPVFNAVFPRLSELAAAGDDVGLRRFYHQATQLMAVVILPVALILILFSFDIILLWTGNPVAARQAGPIVTVLMIGMSLNGLMTMPYALQLAHGWTGIGLRINTFLLVLMVPAIIVLTTHFGVVGGASAWPLLNLIYMLIGVPLTHRRLLRGEVRHWFVQDIGLALLPALLMVTIGRWLIDSSDTPVLILNVICIGILLASTLLASALGAPQIRRWVVMQVLQRTSHQP